MPQKYSSTVISDSSVISIIEVSEAGLQRVFSVRYRNKELGNVTLDSWRAPSLSLSRSGVFVWGGTRAFRLRVGGSPEQFTVDEEIAALYPHGENIVLVCELSVRLLDNAFREVGRYSGDEVLGPGWWEGEILHVSGECKQLDFGVNGGRLKQI